MIKINNLDDEKTQNILKSLGFFSREAYIDYYDDDTYNIWVKPIALDNYESPLYAEILINSSFHNDNCVRLYVDAANNLGDEKAPEFDCLSLDNELDFLMQMINSGLSIEIVKNNNK